MLAFGIELLTGRYVATAYNDRERPEWPPHPARFFSALVATWGENDPDSDAGRVEADALRWLDQQPAPRIFASGLEDIAERSPSSVFVPVNDVAVIAAPDTTKLADAEAALKAATDDKARAKAEKTIARLRDKLLVDTVKAVAAPTKAIPASALGAAHSLFPESRSKQARTFPSVAPRSSMVVLLFPDADPTDAQREILTRLVSRLVRLGHSSSLVHVRLLDDASVPAVAAHHVAYVPDEDGAELMLRWVGPGQFDRLNDAYRRHQEVEPRVLPAVFVGYRVGRRLPPTPIEGTIFDDDLVIFARVAGPRLPSISSAGVSRQFRRALMSFADNPSPELLSGHRASGPPSEQPHLAVVPLPFVGHEHAEGEILGIALCFPRNADQAQRRAVMAAIARAEEKHAGPDDGADPPAIRLLLGAAGELWLQRIAWGEHRSTTLQSRTWSRPSRIWMSATPVALDRNPGDLHDPDPARREAAFTAAAADVMSSLRRIGLATPPVEVDVLRSCVLPGSAKPRMFPRFPIDTAKPQRVLVHVRLCFPEPVSGPLLIGSGRFQGLGLMRPMDPIGGARQ